MIRLPVLFALLSLAACGAATKDLTAAGKGPGMYFCSGQATISAVGQAGMMGGNGSITFNCPGGAYFGEGYPIGPLPVLPQATQPPSIPNFPPIGTPPTAN